MSLLLTLTMLHGLFSICLMMLMTNCQEKSETYAFITVDEQWHLTAYAPWRPVQSTCQIKHSCRHNVQKMTLLGGKDNGQGRDGLCEERDLQKYE